MGMGFGTDLIPGLIGGKPKIPPWQTIDLGGEQTKAINENTASLPALESLASGVNTFNQDQIMAMLRKAIPGYDAQVSKVNDVINSELAGQIPKDVQAAIERSGAAKSLAGGYAGSGMAHDLVARDLGLASLGLTQKGLDSASKWIQQSAALLMPGMFNLTSMFVTPQQQFEDTFQNQEAQFQRDYVSNMNDYQHSFKKLLADDVQGTAQTLLSYFGGSMFGGGGMGGKSGGGFQMDSPNFPNELQG